MAEGKEESGAEGLGETGPASLSPAAVMAIGARRGQDGAGSDDAFDAFLRRRAPSSRRRAGWGWSHPTGRG
jgi:hypothetical protein